MTGSQEDRGARALRALARSIPARALAALASLATLASGCAAELDMSRVAAPDDPHTTIRYSAVREETRQYPDYGAIRADVLAPPDPPSPERPRTP
jgi:hypothetical protein